MKMKKNYITPQIAVFTCNSESPLAGLSGGNGTSNVGTVDLGFDNKKEEGGSSELSKDNSGMSGMSWDEEE